MNTSDELNPTPDLSHAKLDSCNLSGARLIKARMVHVVLKNASLAHADLRVKNSQNTIVRSREASRRCGVVVRSREASRRRGVLHSYGLGSHCRSVLCDPMTGRAQTFSTRCSKPVVILQRTFIDWALCTVVNWIFILPADCFCRSITGRQNERDLSGRGSVAWP